jgi:hypothetical protein
MNKLEEKSCEWKTILDGAQPSEECQGLDKIHSLEDMDKSLCHSRALV